MLAHGQEDEQGSTTVVAVVCLQAQRVAGLPASVGQIELTCRLVQHPPHVHPLDDLEDDDDGVGDCHEATAAQRASASVSSGSGDFRSQVLLLHCGAITPSLRAVLTVSLTLRHPGQRHHQQQQQQHLQVHLGAERPGVLTYPLTGAAAGGLLTLALHRKLLSLPPPSTATSCCLPLPACCRQRRRGINTTNKSHNQQQQQQHGIQYDSGDESSSGFIIIEKELRRPPSESLPTAATDSNIDQDNMKLDQEELDRVEDEFLAMLELSAGTTTCVELDFDLDLHLYLDKLVREAEAELGNASTTHLPNLLLHPM
ncbi:hypothetical protein CFC21_110959 [Triticum aestivum]|uniref:Uncharacterized protein n=3 Tax=Triticinae TaxID=1648030 RepID=A0A3B6TQR0_WHEAT|nr:hypothetical protein CFC21_110959 [Triticum aestivum]